MTSVAPSAQVPVVPVRRKPRLFMWFFLAVQALFLLWVFGGIGSASGTPTDCGSLSAESCNAAQDIGTGIGVALVIGLWMVVDFLLAVGYGVYRLARRP